MKFRPILTWLQYAFANVVIVALVPLLALQGMPPMDWAWSWMNRAKTIVLEYPLIAGNKSVLANRGVPRMWVRPPLIDLTESQEREMVSRLRAEGLI